MATVTNKTKLPLAVPLPGGKKLRLGPRMTGNVSDKALEHPPLVALVEAGDLEIDGEGGPKRGKGGTSGLGPVSNPNRSATRGLRHTGDR